MRLTPTNLSVTNSLTNLGITQVNLRSCSNWRGLRLLLFSLFVHLTATHVSISPLAQNLLQTILQHKHHLNHSLSPIFPPEFSQETNRAHNSKSFFYLVSRYTCVHTKLKIVLITIECQKKRHKFEAKQSKP